MRKQTKIAVVASAAALLAMGASMTSFAAGWTMEDGVWVYLDKDGDRVYEEWKRSGSEVYWLDENGEMAISQIVEDDNGKYYVDEQGRRVVNQWISMDNEDDWGDGVDTVWFYFGSNGKAYEDAKKSIGGKTYIFDEGGYMFSGWHDYVNKNDGKTYTYYLGDENEGWAYTGWQLLEPSDDMVADTYEDEEWFNFKSSGTMRANGRAYLDGEYYEFNSDGVMVAGWVPPVATDPNATYYSESGAQGTGWVKAYAQSDIAEDGDTAWYYLNSKGKPFNAGNTATSATALKYTEGTPASKNTVGVAAKVIKKETYLFDNTGKLLTGVYNLSNVNCTNASGTVETLNGIYYFNKSGGSVQGQMETGKQTITYDGSDYYYSFNSDGTANVNKIVDGVLYGSNGVRISADEGNAPYRLLAATSYKSGSTWVDIAAEKMVIVNASGKVKKTGSIKIDGDTYKVENYVVTTINDVAQ